MVSWQSVEDTESVETNVQIFSKVFFLSFPVEEREKSLQDDADDDRAIGLIQCLGVFFENSRINNKKKTLLNY